jgi:hypothetical protein
VEDRSKDKHIHKTSMIIHIFICRTHCNSGTSLWHSGEERKESRRHNDIHGKLLNNGGGREGGKGK